MKKHFTGKKINLSILFFKLFKPMPCLLSLLFFVFTTSSTFAGELITDGSFSSGKTYWTVGGDFWAGTTLSYYKTSPGYAAGGVDSSGNPKNSANGYMYQTITIPSTVSSATLSFWYNITSNETLNTAYDYLKVYIQNSSGSNLATVAEYSNLNKAAAAGSSYYSQKTFDMTSYKGQTVRIYFSATSDSSNTTTFRIDDVSVTYTAGTSDTTNPTVSSFSVTPSSLTLGSTVTISYTVSDAGGSGLKQVELWRANDSGGSPGTWGQITSNTHSGNGPVSGSFTNAPSTAGTYWYGIHVVDNAGNWTPEPSPAKVVVNSQTLTAPTPISPGEAIGSTHTPIAYSSITFSWNKNNTGATYNLYVRDITGYADDVSTSYGTLVINGQNVGDASSYSWTGAQAGKKYRWQVEVVKTGYTSVLSDRLVFETQAAVNNAPSPPTSLVAVGSSNNILMVWADNSSNETGFKIERKTGTAGTYSQIATVGTGVIQYQDSNLTFGNTYCYRVRAYNSNGDSAYSNESCGTTLATPVLSSPNDGATINTNSVTLQWNSVTGADSYSVEVASSCGGTNILTNAATYSPSITVTSIANGTYYWRVKAANTTTYFGLSDASGCRSFTITATSVLAPTVTTLAATNITSNSATLNGTVNPNGLSTTVYFQYSASTTSWLATGSADAGSGTTASTWQATPSGLNSNTTFYFRIVATNSAGTTYGTTQTFTTASSVSLSNELITNGSFSSGFDGWTKQGVDSWAGTNLTNYRTSPGYAALGVDSSGWPKNNADGAFYQTVSIPANVTTASLSFWYYISTNEINPIAYDYIYVTVRDSSGNFLAYAATLSNVNATSGYVEKTFDMTPYKGQTVRIRFGAITDPEKTTTFRIDDVSVKTDTVDSSGPGLFSSQLTATPKYWSGDSQDSAGPGIELNWGAASNTTGYDIYRNGTVIKSDLTGTTFWNITGLTAGQTYTYYVVAKNSYGTRKSNETSAVAPNPTGISGTVTLAGGAGLDNVSMYLSGAASQTAFSGTDGSYSFTPLVDGSYTVTPSKTGYTFYLASKPVTVSGNQVTGQNFKACSTSKSLSGIVKDNIVNSVKSGVTVMVDNTYQAITDSSGYYTFSGSGLSCGTHTVIIDLTQYGYVKYSNTVDISASPTLNISLTKPETVYGANTSSGYSLDPVNTATGNYIFNRKDIEMPGRGLPFIFERNYNSQDAQDGPFGFGWNHNYNSTITVNSDSSVTIRWGDGKTESYISDGSGGYTSYQDSVFDTLSKNTDGTYTLKKKDQTAYNFDTANKLSSITDKNDNAITLTYTGNNLTQIADTAGRLVAFTYDANNRITQITDPIGRTVKFTYDASGNLVSSADMNSNVTWHTYDVNYQMLTATDPRGNIFVTNVYDAQKRVVTSQKDAKQGQTTYTYDEANRKTTIVDQMNYTTIHYFDDLLRLIQETDHLGNSTYYTYDAAGNRTEAKNKNGNSTRYEYDARGNVKTKTDAHEGVTTITYDANNNPLSRTDALNNQTVFEYDSKGNLKKTTDPSGKFASITYNNYGQPLTITDANNNTATNTYDNEGNLIEITNALGNKTVYTYDGIGRKLSEKDALNRTTTYTYDNNSNLLSVTNPLNNTTVYTYDGNNNKLSVKDPIGNTTRSTYDVKDLLETVTDPDGKTIVYTYDPLDRKTSVKDKNGNTTTYTYDEVGNLVKVTDALLNQTTYTYDANGNKETETNSLGKTTTYKYDKLNRVVKVTDPLENAVTTSYDKLGRVISTTNANSQTTSFDYDKLGRLIKVTDADNKTVEYGYDANGKRISMKDPNGNTTTYTYDALNKLVKKTEPLGVYQYAYDAVGNRISMTAPNKNAINYTYDELNRLVKTTYPDASSVSYTYDANGNRLKMIDSLGTTNYQYDALNRLTGYTDSFGKAVGYGYDPNGNRATLTYPDGKTVSYTYDKLSRLETVKDWLNRTTTYSYDTAGRLSGATNANNTAVAYTYDDSGRLAGLKNSKSDATVISSYTYTLDPVGNHSQSVQNEPLAPNIADQNIAYNYDAENRLTSVAGAAVTHDANGNMTAKGSDTFTYDYNDRLVQSNIAGVVSQYSYDGLGNRLAKTEGGKTTRYALDINGRLSNVIAETDANGNITAYYVHGLGLISKILPDGTASYYHYDSRGSTIALTDASQTITDAYAYDPFGKVANSTGSTPNPFKYVGGYGLMDEGNGLTYIRARYYSPELGRFITKDLKTGKDNDGQSLNRYVYAVNNPVRLVDISGFSAKEVSGTTSNNNGSSDPIFLHNKLLNSNAVFITAPQLSEEEQYKSAMQVKGMEKFSSFIQRGLVDIVAEGGKTIGNRLFPGMGAAFKAGVKLIAEDIQLERKLEPIANWMVESELRDEKGRQFLIKVGEGKYIIFEVEEFLHQIDEQLKDWGIPPMLKDFL